MDDVDKDHHGDRRPTTVKTGHDVDHTLIFLSYQENPQREIRYGCV